MSLSRRAAAATPHLRVMHAGFPPGTRLLLAMTALALGPFDAMAIPAFARRYKVTCALCHNPMPTLTEFGNRFAANGYRMASGEAMPDSIGTNDPCSRSPTSFPWRSGWISMPRPTRTERPPRISSPPTGSS